jgi:hypothetical protein
MRPSTAAALVGAAVLSTLIFPILGLRLRGDLAEAHLEKVQAEAGAEAAQQRLHPHRWSEPPRSRN